MNSNRYGRAGFLAMLWAGAWLAGCEATSLTVQTQPTGATVYAVPYDEYQMDPSVAETEEIEFFRVGRRDTPVTIELEPGRYLLVVRLGRQVQRLELELAPQERRTVELMFESPAGALRLEGIGPGGDSDGAWPKFPAEPRR